MFKLADRVKETTATTGTGTLTLAGAVTSFQTFLSAIGNGSTTTFMTTDGTNWEVARGALSGGTSLTRAAILASSNAGAAVNWGVGNKTVALVHPAGRVNDVLIDSQDASASSSVDFTGLDGTYDEYIVRFYNVMPASDGVALNARASEAASFSTSLYNYAAWSVTEAGVSAALPDDEDAEWTLHNSVGNAAGEGVAGEFRLARAASSGASVPNQLANWHVAGYSTTGNLVVYMGSGGRNNAMPIAIDGLRFLFSSGNITSGTFRLYGRRAI